MTQPITVVVPVYNGVTQLDFTGPHQFLSRTPDLHVRVASMDGQPVTADRLRSPQARFSSRAISES
jgi:putative intracellular protease/amidase